MKKKLLSAILITVMILSMGLPVFAAEKSPVNPPDDKPANPGYVVSSNFDVNSQDHACNIVKTKVGEKTTVVREILCTPGDDKAEVHLRTARNKDNKRIPISHVGNGVTSLFNSKSSQNVKIVAIKSDRKVTIRANAFGGSKVERLYCSSSFFEFQKDCFKGTGYPKLVITFDDMTKYSGRLVFDKGCFNGLNKGSRTYYSSRCTASVTFNRCKKNMLAAGYQGTVILK
jgi:hypothetical protein